MQATTVVNLKGHRDDPAYADVVYVGRAMYRGRPSSSPSAPTCAGADSAAGAYRNAATLR
ncbi:hypothetical protein EV384_3869 [Micromonospora kangleipakensis]|uniref:Uncharacterized protein n=1 Tax=Micromonospora kangleipakensis TaxID=1077942 RepID=A0A4Q8BBX5_9ACTN|nr:hypothetical protein [Micromonospora kangleipakensis]RZU75334.1 hypothetical protein EV384_3869 [Micromonospora kangleipakensis]